MMRIIIEFTANPKQTCTLVLENQETVTFRLYFLPTQLSWYFDFTYNDIVSNGNKIVLGMNILRSFKNIIPFGLAFQANDGVEPFAVDDFTTGRVSVYLLSKADVEAMEINVYGV
jgi:hypothetical protein